MADEPFIKNGRIAKILLEKALDLNGPFQFSSLKLESPMKMKVDKVLSNGVHAKTICLYLYGLLNGRKPSSVGGVATGGMPWASRVAYFSGLPEFYVKKDGSLDGADIKYLGDSPALIEDVVTTGKSLDDAVQNLRRSGKEPIVGSIFNYGFRMDISSLVYLEDIIEDIPEPYQSQIKVWYEKVKMQIHY